MQRKANEVDTKAALLCSAENEVLTVEVDRGEKCDTKYECVGKGAGSWTIAQENIPPS